MTGPYPDLACVEVVVAHERLRRGERAQVHLTSRVRGFLGKGYLKQIDCAAAEPESGPLWATPVFLPPAPLPPPTPLLATPPAAPAPRARGRAAAGVSVKGAPGGGSDAAGDADPR